jgi:hypothetical protein
MLKLPFSTYPVDLTVPLYHAPRHRRLAERFARLATRVWRSLPSAVSQEIHDGWWKYRSCKEFDQPPLFALVPSLPVKGRRGSCAEGRISGCSSLASELFLFDADWVRRRTDEQVEAVVSHELTRSFRQRFGHLPPERLANSFEEKVRRVLEACVPDKTGARHHDDRTGYKCRPDGPVSLPAGPPSAPGEGNPDRRTPAGGGTSRGRSPASSPGNASGGRSKNGIGSESQEPSKQRSDSNRARTRKARRRMGSVRSRVGNDNEHRFAEGMGKGYRRLPDSEAVDVVKQFGDGREDGYELKTMLTNKHGRIHMSRKQRLRKEAWLRCKLRGIVRPRVRPDPACKSKRQRRLHVVVIDHRKAYSKRRQNNFEHRKLDMLYYAREPKAWAVKNMIQCDSVDAVRKLSAMDEAEFGRAWKKYAGKTYSVENV